MSRERHSWGEPTRLQFETQRTCVKCGLVKVTNHEDPHRATTEFYRDGAFVGSSAGTPPCKDEGEGE